MLAGLGAALALGSAPGAEAAGVTVGDAATPRLQPVDGVKVSVRLDDERAVVTESRSYRAGEFTFDAEPVRVVFHRSLIGAPDAELESASLDSGRGAERLEGEVLEPEAADELRTTLAVALANPSLLREIGAPMFVSRAFELQAGAAFTVELETVSGLEPRGTLRAVSVPLDWHGDDVSMVSVDVSAETEAPLRAVYSPYHELSIKREGEHQATASYSGRGVCSRFDVAVMLSTGTESLHVDLLPYHDGEDDGGYVLGLLTPLAQADAQAQGRDIVLVLDVSGSMAGEKILQAKQALTDVIAGLNARDSLSLVSFSGLVTAWGDAAAPATKDAKARAIEAIDALIAEGGTNISGALESAFERLPQGGSGAATARAQTVVLLTDGQPTEGLTDIEAIAELAVQRNEGRSRLFVFGLGPDVNTLLLDRLAKESGGRALYVGTGAVEQAVAEFFAGIAAPVLVQPALDLAALRLTDVFPEQLPELYAGRTQSFVARYPGAVEDRLAVTGATALGRVQLTYDVALAGAVSGDGSVARLWALRKVGAILEQLKIRGPLPELQNDLLAIARRFGVVTAFTGFQEGADGNVELVLWDVPTDAVGATAVSTSSSIDGYSSSETSADAIDTTVRYFEDRNFPLNGGYRTDAKLSDVKERDWIDLHFGSERTFDLLRDEASTTLAGLLSIGSDVRFEYLGRKFRITDPTRVGVNPEQDVAIPAPSRTLEPNGQTNVRFIETTQAASPDHDPGHEPRLDGVTEAGVGCHLAARPGPRSSGGFGALLLLGLGVRRRRGSRAGRFSVAARP